MNKLFTYPCGESDDCHSIKVSLPPGPYEIQCWGASGGLYNSLSGGRGAYASGIIILDETTDLFLFIGSSGKKVENKRSFNGGGLCHRITSCTTGGGSTDVRLKDQYDFDGLMSRIIVAGGGGGGTTHYNNTHGGDAGSIAGFPGNKVGSASRNAYVTVPMGGNQSSGGDAAIGYNLDGGIHSASFPGNFGYGGNNNETSQFGGGGGGGYFGGGGGSNGWDIVSSGGGGSSYVSGHPDCLAISSESTESSIIMKNESIHESGIVLLNPIMKSGNEIFISSQNARTIGNIGNGAIRIRSLISSCTNQFVKTYFHSLLLFFVIIFS